MHAVREQVYSTYNNHVSDLETSWIIGNELHSEQNVSKRWSLCSKVELEKLGGLCVSLASYIISHAGSHIILYC